MILFQHDNDPKHTSRGVKKYLSNQSYNVLEWPAQSPDLSPLENLWKQVKDQIGARPQKSTSLSDLFAVVKEEWNKIPLEYIQHIVISIINRPKAVLEANGFSTKY